MTGEAGPASAAKPRTLTRALTSFVGRDEAIAKVAGLLEQGRLVTVTGPGGVGKTRFADEILRRVAERFADGVCVVELAAIAEAALVPVAVATALGLKQTGGASITDAVAARLARQQLLLVLDNCEHLLEAAAEFCARVLPAADDIKILATSREPLGLPEETRYRLAPLAVPGPAGPLSRLPRPGPAGGGRAVSDQGGEPAAVTLFIERARQVDPELALDGTARALVEQLVRRLDGMPMAIELAAARVEALGLAQLAELLDDRLRLLVSVNRGVPARQRSLEATVDWSYRLLADPEQRAFRFLSVFPGPFTLEGAEAVAGAEASLAVLRLVDCSLLAPPQAGPDGRTRYAMLESLRGFGRDRLRARGEDQAAAAALAAHALAVAERAAVEREDPDREVQAALWLDAEDAALHQGISWDLEHDPPAALRIAVALAQWWVLRGRWIQGDALLRRAVAATSPGANGWYAAQVQLLTLSLGMPDYPRVFDQASAALDMLRSAPPTIDLVDGLVGRSTALRNMGSLEAAAVDANLALETARQIDSPTSEALALTELSSVARYADQVDEAIVWARQAQLVDLRRVPGRRVRLVRLMLPWALMAGGQLDEAKRLLAGCLAAARNAGDPGMQADILYALAGLARRTGQLAEARVHLRESARLALSIDHLLRLIDLLDEAGMQCAEAGRHAEAVALWAAMTVQNEAAGLASTEEDARFRDPPLQQARKALGPRGCAAAEQRGAAMTLAAAVDFAVLTASTEALPRPEAAQQAAGGVLSPRERELVALVAQGTTDAEIAGKLFISVATVRSHLDRIRDKTGNRRRADLTRLALREGII